MSDKEIKAEAERLWDLTQADFILEGKKAFSGEEIFGISTALVRHTKLEMPDNDGLVSVNETVDNLSKLYHYLLTFWMATLDKEYNDEYRGMLEAIEVALKLLKQIKTDNLN